MTSAQSALEEYDGVALGRNEIGDNFKDRKNVAKAEIKSVSEHKSRLENEHRELERKRANDTCIKRKEINKQYG